MAIFGIGVDSIEIIRFKQKNLFSLAKRVLTESEFHQFNESQSQKVFVAKRFAIKEAVSKALGTGIGSRIAFKDITISHNILGRPICTVKQDILENITNSSTTIIHISLTDTTTTVSAYAIAEIKS